MAIIKCKMCGGDLALVVGSTIVECEYCGSWQTVPVADSEKKLMLFARANRLRTACEFDKAAGIYEAIVAEFPQEAEAYWGLVLCKYGIEYVDDPATGKKIPTCHRSSFDCILEDSDFEQALENADSAARRLYREEAKQIELLRRNIIAVSANEDPYDIFICYKETDEHGNRTLDSVLSQDLYDALTARGYRVFFSRITLEDKLGQEYEPFIFAALNSARIMLAVGTDYEFYNSVWVKNEWSRFLKLMTKDKHKHLIPCYKGIDAYDMPSDFTKLQAQDLGKIGAVQDILRGVEKLLPRHGQTEPIVHHKDSFHTEPSVGSRISGMLDRGFLALEDGDWEQADHFFEEVLNHDARNSQGYIGKVLAEERCPSMAAFLEKRKARYLQVEPETITLCADPQYVEDAVQKYRIPGYLEAEQIRKLYGFEYSYVSCLRSRKEQFLQEKAWWTNHKLLSRAEKFAAEEDARRLHAEKNELFKWLSQQAVSAKNEAVQKKEKILACYQKDLTAADQKAAQLHQEAAQKREWDYKNLLERKSQAATEEEFYQLYKAFAALEDYADCPALAQECRDKAPGIKDSGWKEMIQNYFRHKKLFLAAVAIATAVVIWIGCMLPNFIITTMLKQIFKDDSAETTLTESTIAEETASLIPESVISTEPVSTDPQALAYAEAEQLLAEGEYAKAAIAFGKLADYADARQRSFDLWDTVAKRDTISGHSILSLGLRSDGTVLVSGDKFQGDVSTWSDIIAVSAGFGSVAVGLKSDGTVVAEGDNRRGHCNVSDWTDIVAISSGRSHTVGLKCDGTVVCTTPSDSVWNLGLCDIENWTDIVAIDAGMGAIIGLKSDGTVVIIENTVGSPKPDFHNTDLSGWADIVAIDAGTGAIIGLKSDGTVVAAGSDEELVNGVKNWTDIVAVAAGTNGKSAGHLLGLRKDGTVLAVGNNGYGKCNVNKWEDIYAISGGWDFSLALRTDGRVLSTGCTWYNRCDVSGWTDIKQPTIPVLFKENS